MLDSMAITMEFHISDKIRLYENDENSVNYFLLLTNNNSMGINKLNQIFFKLTDLCVLLIPKKYNLLGNCLIHSCNYWLYL